jgi:outer membrane protein assembly factor BamE
MKKLLIVFIPLASAFLVNGCSRDRIADNLPGIYKSDVIQGNVVNQEDLNQLTPGMSRRQVRYLLGTPLVVDVFHQNRWDYLNMNFSAGKQTDKNWVSLYFDNDQLTRIEGDMRPGIEVTTTENPNFEIEVPKQQFEERGIITEALDNFGILGDEEEKPSEKEQTKQEQKEAEKGFIKTTLDRFGLGDE